MDPPVISLCLGQQESTERSTSRRAAFLRWLVFFFHDAASSDVEAARSSRNSAPFRPEEEMVGAARHFSTAHKVRFG
ncbi:hypothetical protein D5086_030797 [Populus alba]|uniref:Uncharacterized protein n=1 Tax=Populus alba TaxID=43335 RepID=A0ACC4AQB5_POPAL